MCAVRVRVRERNEIDTLNALGIFLRNFWGVQNIMVAGLLD